MLGIRRIIIFTFLWSVGQADDVPRLQKPQVGGFLTVRTASALNLLIKELLRIWTAASGVKSHVFLSIK